MKFLLWSRPQIQSGEQSPSGVQSGHFCCWGLGGSRTPAAVFTRGLLGSGIAACPGRDVENQSFRLPYHTLQHIWTAYAGILCLSTHGVFSSWLGLCSPCLSFSSCLFMQLQYCWTDLNMNHMMYVGTGFAAALAWFSGKLSSGLSL